MGFLDNLLNNQNFQIGMEMLGGKRSYGDAVNLLATADYTKQRAKSQLAEMQQQQYLRENIGQIMQNIDPNDLPGSFARLVQSGVPPQNASAFIENIRKQQAQQQLQGLLSGILGGGGAAGVTPGVTQGVTTGETQGAGGIPTAGGGNDMARKGMALMAGGALGGNAGIATLGKTIYDNAMQAPLARGKEQAKADVKRESVSKDNIQGAQEFLNKVGGLQQSLGLSTDNNGNIIPTKQSLNTGAVKGSETNRAISSTFGTDEESQRRVADSYINDLQLAVARMNFKGQGQVSDMERKLAKSTLPSVTNEPRANAAIINKLIKQANFTIQQGQKQQGNNADLSIDATLQDSGQPTSYLPKTQPGQSKAEAAAEEAIPTGGNIKSIPPRAIQALRQNPSLAKDFEAKYGVSARGFLQ